MTDPRFPNRPEHPDFWLMSEVLVSGDAARDNNTIPFDDHVNQVVDLKSLTYMAEQQVIQFLNSLGNPAVVSRKVVAGAVTAAWMTAFQYGIRFQALRASKADQVRLDDSEALVTAAVQLQFPDAVSYSVGVEEWDNGFWYSENEIRVERADGSIVLMEVDEGDANERPIHEALTELSERDGTLGRHDTLDVALGKAYEPPG